MRLLARFRVTGLYIRCSTDGSIVVLTDVQFPSIAYCYVAET